MKGQGGTAPATLRGLLVLAVAVVFGFALLSNTDDLGGSTTTRSDGPTTTTGAPDTSDPVVDPPAQESTTSTTVVKGHPVADVRVIVVNGSAGLAPGVAAASTDELDGVGYQTGEPGNGPARDATVVLYADGFEADARAVQLILTLPGTVEPLRELPTPAAEGSDVVIVLGRDAASLSDEVGGGSTSTTVAGGPTTPTVPGGPPSSTTSTTSTTEG